MFRTSKRFGPSIIRLSCQHATKGCLPRSWKRILCARPAIVTNVGGNAELLEDGRSGFVAPAPTIKHLNEAMERAWDRRALEPRYSISPPSAPSANGDLNLELFQRLGLPLNLACKRCER